jgi:putative uncharacterized protein (fragment)
MTPSRANLKRLLSINIILELVLNRFTWPKVGELHVKGKGKKVKRYVNLYVNRDYSHTDAFHFHHVIVCDSVTTT